MRLIIGVTIALIVLSVAVYAHSEIDSTDENYWDMDYHNMMHGEIIKDPEVRRAIHEDCMRSIGEE